MAVTAVMADAGRAGVGLEGRAEGAAGLGYAVNVT